MVFSRCQRQALKRFFLFVALLIGYGENGYAQASSVPEIVMGRSDAPVTILEYFCRTCGHCAQFHQEVLPLIKEKYIDTGRVKYVMRDFPLNALSLKAAQVVHCDPTQRDRIANILNTSQEKWVHPEGEKKLLQLLKVHGVSEQHIQSCLNNTTLQRAILTERLDAQKKYNITGTPTFVINGKSITGCMPYKEFERHIEEAEVKARQKNERLSP